ncbi:hypothetical protein UA08_00818 [Talaromyces atroroseus]|uniref:Reverse transcriptase domain-containing protein n=1 Tax=Talaromyces atroroseus TaxID=1441469 RepID=A0A225AUA8_TALAT|nr:hypothetical protein UA08_00818 [Talaromyces atroroseus]OKL64520.1 hypothetical protein UA08_00818 [Talaromyces atroroseus]
MASALPLTLKSISSTKLEELSKQRTLFNQRKAEILHAANNAADDSDGLRRKVQILLEGVTRLAGRAEDAFDREDDIDLDHVTPMASAARLPISPDLYTTSDWERSRDINIRRFLFQSNYDSSVSDDVLRRWISSLENDLKFLSVKYEHATFYSSMVAEWLSNFKDGRANVVKSHTAADDSDDEAKSNRSSFEEIGRAEMHQQRHTWERLVFSPADVDSQSIETYLNRLFNRTRLSQQALRELRDRIKSFGSMMKSEARNSFDISLLKIISKSLLASDLLSSDKVMILKEFLRNDEVAQEVADVLNLRFAALDRWDWPAEGIPVEMRRQLNGKYRVYTDEDLIDTLLFHYIGLKWSVEFRQVFFEFLRSPAWKPNTKPISKADIDRRHFFVGNVSKSLTVDDLRKSMYQDDYFMSQLPASLIEGKRGYDDDDDDGVNEGPDKRKSPIETKHSLLHLLITESIIHNRLRGQFTVIRSDFKWFGPSLPHGTLLAVLQFFGVPDDWLGIFKKYLECPLRFAQDGPEASVRIRRRGIPISHSLSDVFGEAVLFCMDYAVNQQADGAFLYRLHDDFWFWGEEKTCRKAWRAMTDFTAVTGLEFNEEKTGTARIGTLINLHDRKRQRQEVSDSSSSDEEMGEEEEKEEFSESDDDAETYLGINNGFDPLPRGDIRWGFLRLDAGRGRFLIDQEQVDVHIEELRHQLSACKSIFTWVQAWNSYFSRFFSNNFAKPSIAFGREHIDMAINTLSRIEREVFAHTTSKASGNGGVVDHLRRVIADRFDIRDLPDGFFFFPVELGGLELHNPFINFLSMRENITQTPQRIMEKVYIMEEADYESAKKKWREGSIDVNRSSYRRSFMQKSLGKNDDADSPEAFFSFEEYTANLESTSKALFGAYKTLLQVPEETEIGQNSGLSHYMFSDGNNNRSGNTFGRGRGRGRGRGGLPWNEQRQQDRIVVEGIGMTPYWSWVAEVYRGGMLQKYGGLSAVDRALMPLGVVKVLRQGKVRWQG